MAKGAESKVIATQKILDLFEGSFAYDKEIRIPMIENGEEIQLKCVLTCAKTNVMPNGDVAIPGEKPAELNFEDTSSQITVEPTDEEKENVSRLAKMLNL